MQPFFHAVAPAWLTIVCGIKDNEKLLCMDASEIRLCNNLGGKNVQSPFHNFFSKSLTHCRREHSHFPSLHRRDGKWLATALLLALRNVHASVGLWTRVFSLSLQYRMCPPLGNVIKPQHKLGATQLLL